ncbi:hypothetical protein V5F41_12540 [Xanthobacter autotrophicus]|uniref:hypothetical protein n=1 Tax=Xanthobacter autotrophicus TaxID=280 RepID=UPI003727E1A9
MLDATSIGIAALGFLFGYMAGAIQGIGAMERQWRAGYRACEQTQAWAVTPAARPEGGDHG